MFPSGYGRVLPAIIQRPSSNVTPARPADVPAQGQPNPQDAMMTMLMALLAHGALGGAQPAPQAPMQPLMPQGGPGGPQGL